MCNVQPCIQLVSNSRGISRIRKFWLQLFLAAAMSSGIAARVSANDVLINGAPGPGDSTPTEIVVNPGSTDDVVVNVDTIDLTGPASDTIRVNGGGGNTLLSIDAGRFVSGASSTGAYLKSTSGNITAVIDGELSSAFNGITLDSRFAPAGGDVTLAGTGNLFATGGTGAWLLTDVGSVTVDGFNSINAGGQGIYVNSSGTVQLGTNSPLGTILAGTIGIEVDQLFDPANNGPIIINATDITANGGFGIRTRGHEADTAITVTGTLQSGGATGIYATSTTGNIMIRGGGTGIINGGDSGIIADTRFLPLGGNVVISDFTAVTSVDTGIWALADTGTVNIDSIGSVNTGGHGVLVNSTGTVSVGQTAAMGPIFSGQNGIFIEQLFDSSSNGSIFASATNITSGTHGIRTISWEELTQIQASGAIASGFTGIYGTSTTGDIEINIAPTASVRGNHFGVATETTTGLATVNNSGLISNTADTGAAHDSGATGFRAFSGRAVINNSGRLIGGIDSTGTDSFTLNNLATGVWTPSAGVIAFNGTNDIVDNSGRINLRTGWTLFNGLETFVNQPGGHIDLSYGPGATDHLELANFATTNGSQFSFNFDAAGANNSGAGFDNSTDGLGTADTIVVTGTSAPSGTSFVNVVATSGQPTAETGSVSLIYTGVDLTAPAATTPFLQSSFFRFGSGNPTNGTIAYYLVDDGNGGLYLQWGPNNNSAAALGAFMGGTLHDNQFAPSAMNTTVGRLGTIIGGIGGIGGPSGGGIAGRIGDDASSSLLRGGSSRCIHGRYHKTWFLTSSAGTDYSTGGHGSAFGYAGGVERDLFNITGARCGRTAVGVFVFENQANDRWLNGSTKSDANGMGVYLRAASDAGFYGSLLGSVSWSESDIVNGIYQSTGSQDNTGYSVVAVGGFLQPVSDRTFLDFRGFASRGNANGDGFTDSNGMTVSGLDTGITTLGIMSGLNHSLDVRQSVFGRMGLKWFDVDRNVSTASGTSRGSVDAVVGSAEIGYRKAVTKSVSFDAVASGDVGEAFVSGGGRVGVTLGW